MYSDAAGVLTRADIHKIRHYVQHKHGDLPKERRAEIVADAMQRIVLRQLPDFPEEQKQSVTRTLLRDVVAGKGVPVNESHIFEACMALNVEEPEVILPLHRWAEQRLGAAVAFRLFRDAVEEGTRIAGARVADGARGAVDPELGLTAWDAVTGTVGLRVAERGEARAGLIDAGRTAGGGRLRNSAVYMTLSVMLCAAMLAYGWRALHPAPIAVVPLPPAVHLPAPVPSVVQQKNALPDSLRFVDVDRARLNRYLRAKSSLLAEEPYMSTIINAAKDHDIHPLLLFAITGQEQGFVPKTAKNAKKIANNPFNVFYSWQAFNTTIAESAKIAGNTINRLSFERPANVDAVKWINREYATDEQWSTGVNSILKSMVAQIMTDK